MRLACLVLTALLAAGCAHPGVRPGASEAEVHATLGRPALELALPGGARQLAYPTGPFGTHTYMVHLDGQGRVTQVEQVLDDGRFHLIRPGMTREELLRLIGPPAETMRFGNLGQTSWDYRFVDTWGYTAILSVMLDDNGIVVGRTTQRLERERRGFF